MAVLRRRRSASRENPIDAVFPTRNGTWQQVNDVERRWRQIRKDAGVDWVTPHTFRKTVATLISERVDAETASQELGHSSPAITAITREFYISKPEIAADVSHVLEELACPEDGRVAARSGYLRDRCGRGRSGSNAEPPLTRVSADQRRSFGRADRIRTCDPLSMSRLGVVSATSVQLSCDLHAYRPNMPPLCTPWDDV